MKITTILSGGMDSVTLLYYALTKTKNIHCISFNYGQKHSKELEKAKQICKDLKIKHTLVDLKSITKLLKSTLTTNKAIPHGHYAKDNMKATVVPNRNAIMLSIAYASAISDNSDVVYYGAHAGDHFIYPDCRPKFITAINKAFQIGNDTKLKIEAPFSKFTKTQIVKIGLELGVPFEKTWSCYEGKKRPCLKCGTCIERTEAFMENDEKDPLLTYDEWKSSIYYYNKCKKNK
jgi:7-cyano-7-deazaguanine synthase